jgi:SAM-dependent methyltransferase
MKCFDLKGKRVLDIGCRDGAQSFAAERLGASEVIGIDNDLSDGLTSFLIPFKSSKVRAFHCNVIDLSRKQFGEFDIVVFPGVLYHLRYPIWGLRRIADVLKPDGVLIIEGEFIGAFADLPIRFCPIGSDSPYDGISVAFFNEAGIIDTLFSLGFSKIQRHDTFCNSFSSNETRERYWKEKFPKFFEECLDGQEVSI